MDLEARIDRLYSLPLAEFVAERNALAKTLRAAGERERSDEVKALAKPNVPAWAVNRLWHGERAAFDRLLEAAAAVRDAVSAGSGQREAAARRSKASRSLMGLAKKHLSEAAHPTTPAVLQKISHTLDAVVALGVERLDPQPGRLSRDLEPPGFDFLAGLQLPLAPKRSTRRRKTPAKKATAVRRSPKPAKPRPAAAAEKRQTQRIAAARKTLEEGRAALAKAAEKSETLQRELVAARKRADRTADEAKRAEQAAKKAAAEAERASERASQAKDAQKEAAESARAARTAVRKATAKVKAGTDRLAKLNG